MQTTIGLYRLVVSILCVCLVQAAALIPSASAAAGGAGEVGLPEAIRALQDKHYPESTEALQVIGGLSSLNGPTNIRRFLVASDGSRSLGDPHLEFNDTRDTGSKIVYFDVGVGNNDTAGVYWWDGAKIVDSDGSAVNPENGQPYGTDPLTPNETAIKPFKQMLAASDPRLRTQMSAGHTWGFAGLAGGYPDWFLFRRGQTHDTFDTKLTGGRSEAEPMVAAAYGPLEDGRAVMAPVAGGTSPFGGHNRGAEKSWLHHVLYSLEMRVGYGYVGINTADTYSEGGGPVTAFIEDCYWPGTIGNTIAYTTQKTTIRRSIITNAYRTDNAHVQGYYTSGFKNRVTFDEVIFYKNGYKTNPVTDPDPKRTIFDRNVYQQGGAKMGHTYRNVLFADGGSGAPQMRVGGRIENSLVVEGYWYSNTFSGTGIYNNDWLVAEGQVGRSALVRNNIQLIFRYPSPADPDTHDVSDGRAQPGSGYMLLGGSFGAEVEGNIISGALLADELQAGYGKYGINIKFDPEEYAIDGRMFMQRHNAIRNNILYKVKNGFSIRGDITGAEDIRVENNVVMATTPVSSTIDPTTGPDQLLVDNNRFYADGDLPQEPWLGAGNSVAPAASAQQAEGWPDPDRTVKRYVQEVLGLTLLDWDDNPFLDPAEKQIRIDAGEAYDPMGLKTFMAVATNMRLGGADPIPSSGKPSMTGDYPWDERFTAIAVVNWIRAGFNMEPVR